MDTITFQEGDVIIEEGSFGTSAFIIDSGKVEVSGIINGQKVIFATLGDKQIFGEMGLIEDKPRSATITAMTETELREISRDGFNELFAKNPKVLLPIVKALFERLRTATKMVAVKIAAAKSGKGEEDLTKEEDVKIIDERYIIFAGDTEFAKQSLDYAELEVKTFPFKVGRYTLGHQRSNDILSDNDFFIKEDSTPYYVSKNHFLIDKVDENIVIIDRGSRLGVIVDGKKVDDSQILKTNGLTEIIVGSSFSPFSYKVEIKGTLKRIYPDGRVEIEGEVKEEDLQIDVEEEEMVEKHYESAEDTDSKA